MQFFESVLEKITSGRRPDSILVVEAGFDELKAVVVDKRSGGLTAAYEAKSQASDFEEALQDVVEKVKRSGWKGRHAIMVTPATCITVLNVNIPPKNKLPPKHIAETLQWEMEPAYSQHRNILTIGQILQLLGYINSEQADDILQQQEALINSKNKTVTFKRFGELALENGIVSRVQLDEAVRRQQWFVSDGELIKCGWNPLPIKDDEDGEYQWVVAGIDQDLLRNWQAAFKKHEIELEVLYPATATGEWQLAAQSNEPYIGSQPVIYLQLQTGIMMATLMVDGLPKQIEIAPSTTEGMLNNVSGLVERLGQADTIPVQLVDCVSVDANQLGSMIADLQTILGRPISAVDIKKGKIDLSSRNASRHYLREDYAGFVEGVSVHEPLPPLMQRFNARAVIGGVIGLGLILLTELGMFGAGLWYTLQSDAIHDDVSRIRGEIKRIKKKSKDINALLAQIDEKQFEKEQASTKLDLLTNELPERNKELIRLMDRLQASVSDDVVVNSIVEDTLLGFNYTAWSLSESAAQSFIKQFQAAISPMGYRIQNVTVSQSPGRLRLIGYSLRFSITKLSEQEYSQRRRVKRIRRRF